MRNIRLPTATLILGSLLSFSCELSVEESIYEERLVVFGHLIANQPIVDTVGISIRDIKIVIKGHSR